jgi:hypothetical protein
MLFDLFSTAPVLSFSAFCRVSPAFVKTALNDENPLN